jgi:hypothetical protein
MTGAVVTLLTEELKILVFTVQCCDPPPRFWVIGTERDDEMNVRFAAIDIKGQYAGSHAKAVEDMRQLALTLRSAHPGVFANVEVAADTVAFNVTAPPQLNPGVSESARKKAFSINISTAYDEPETERAAAAFVRGQLAEKRNFTVLG